MEFIVYILYSARADKYHVGHTGDMDDRLNRHNQGRSTATKTGVPWLLKYTECYATKAEAYQREMKIKSWKSRLLFPTCLDKSGTLFALPKL